MACTKHKSKAFYGASPSFWENISRTAVLVSPEKHIQVVKHGTKHLRSHNNTHQWLSCLVQPLLYHADILSIHNLYKSFKCLLSTRTSTTHRKLCFQSFFLEQPLENGCLAVVVPWKQEPRWTFRQTKTGHLDHTNTKQLEKQVQDSEAFWSLSDTDYIPNTDNTGAFDTSVLSFDFLCIQNQQVLHLSSFDFHPRISAITDVPQWRACCRCPV